MTTNSDPFRTFVDQPNGCGAEGIPLGADACAVEVYEAMKVEVANSLREYAGKQVVEADSADFVVILPEDVRFTPSKPDTELTPLIEIPPKTQAPGHIVNNGHRFQPPQ